jgi:hypothetical protein
MEVRVRLPGSFAREVGGPRFGFLAGPAFRGAEVIGFSLITRTLATDPAEVIPGRHVHLLIAGAMEECR